MRKRALAMVLAAICLTSFCLPVYARSSFCDSEFQGKFSTGALDALIEKYELYDGWYWTTQAGVPQTFHGQQDKPGWTDTAVNVCKKLDYDPEWFGCRWGTDEIPAYLPNRDGWGECFGFAQFIGYLLSGDENPHRDWKSYTSLWASGGFKVGDIVRTEYTINGKTYRHSAVVYSVEDGCVLFLQAAGSSYNLLRTRQGYTDGYLNNETSTAVLNSLPDIRIIRCPQNQ